MDASWISATPALEARYRAQNQKEIFSAYRLTCLIGIALFPAGAVLDYFTQYPTLAGLLVIRLLATAFFVFLYLCSRRGIYPSRNPMISGLVLLGTASAFITAMCLILTGYKSPYFSGINLVMLAAAVMFPCGARRMVAFAGVIIGIFMIAVLAQAGFHIDRVDSLVNATYFLACTAVLGIGSAALSERLRREAFIRLVTTEEAQRKLKESDELKSRFFANISHELRTPLTLILGPVQKLLRERASETTERGALEVIERNAKLLLRHVNDLLDVAKMDAGALTPRYTQSDLAVTLRRLASQFEPLAAERRISFRIEAPARVPAQLDREKIDRILMNILSNAFKFTPAGGFVRAALTLDESTDLAEIAVSDSGPGIPAALRERVFERFYQLEESATRHYGGTGLGLAIVKEFVELLGGAVSISDAPEGGARIHIRIPTRAPAGAIVQATDAVRTDRAPPEAPAAPPIDGRALAPMDSDLPRVLVIEDNLEMADFVRDILSKKFRVASALNAQDGLIQALATPPDLILTDMMMPDMSGEDLVIAARSKPELATVPIIMLTAKADDELRTRVLRRGAQDYVLKPFSADELSARVENLVSMKRARDLLQRELSTGRVDLEFLARELLKRRDELQAALQTSQDARADAQRALKLREEFVSIASHELKTPLTALKLQFQVLKRRRERQNTAAVSSDDLIKFAENSDCQLNRLTRLIEDMLDVSRIATGNFTLEPTAAEVGAIVDEVLEGLATQLRASGSEVHLEPIPEVRVLWDRYRIEQVLINLLTNAMKYGEGRAIHIRVLTLGEVVRLEVRDHGLGISPADQARIFNRFERAVSATHISGLGLGLYISRQIIEAHAGTVNVESELGKGSLFSIELPRQIGGTREETVPVSMRQPEAEPDPAIKTS